MAVLAAHLVLAQRLGLTRGLSAGMRRRGFEPVYDRGQALVDLAQMLIDGGEAISDFRALAHLAPVIGPVPSAPTVWRTLNEAGDLQLARVNAAVAEFRRYWWGLLYSRAEGFPWLRVAGRELTGITVIDLDASIVLAGSEKENAKATYKGGTGFCPNLKATQGQGPQNQRGQGRAVIQCLRVARDLSGERRQGDRRGGDRPGFEVLENADRLPKHRRVALIGQPRDRAVPALIGQPCAVPVAGLVQ